MTIRVGTPFHLDIRVTELPEYDDNDQYIGSCEINGVPHHITLFRVIGDDWDQDAGSGHHYRLDALRAFEADIHGFVPITIGTREYLCMVDPFVKTRFWREIVNR